MMHAVGFLHEQSRVDRDDHITIQWDNVYRGSEYNFKKYDLWQTQLLDTPYDYGSVMHYGAYAFSRNGKPTIVKTRESGPEIGQRIGFSPIDIEEINKLYKCDGTRPKPPVTTPPPPRPTTPTTPTRRSPKPTRPTMPTPRPTRPTIPTPRPTRPRPTRTTTEWVTPRPRPPTRPPLPPPSPSGVGTTFIVENGCYKDIQVAIHFRRGRTEWITGGWWYIRPDDSKRTVQSTNRHFYIHGESTDKKFIWGSKQYSFCACDKGGFWSTCGNNCEYHDFLHIDTGSRYNEYHLILSCKKGKEPSFRVLAK